MHVDKLHDYLRANAMKTLFPREHKWPRRTFLKIFLEFSQPFLCWFLVFLLLSILELISNVYRISKFYYLAIRRTKVINCYVAEIVEWVTKLKYNNQ